MREQKYLFVCFFLLVFVAYFICVTNSSGERQGQELDALLKLKNDTALLEDNKTELFEVINDFIRVSATIYSQIVSLDVNNTEHIDKINTDLLVDEFSNLLVKLSVFHDGQEEKIRKDAENVLEGINSTLYAKIDEIRDKEGELDTEQIELKKEYTNLSIELGILENYTKVVEDKKELEEKLNTSRAALKKDTTIYFTLPFIFGVVLGFMFCLKLRKKQEFMKLFTRVKETRPLSFAVIVSVILMAVAIYICFKYSVLWFL
jgi:hypothetical protein